MPAQPPALQRTSKHIGQLAQNCVEQDAHKHHIGLQKFTRIHGQVADARLGRDGLGHDQNHPHQPQRKTQAHEDGRQRSRQDDVAIQLPAREAVAAAHLDQTRVHVANAVKGVQIDGKEHRDADQKQLGRFVDAEPQNDQRNQRQRRDVAHHLDRGIEQRLGPAQRACEQPQQQAQAAANGQPRQRTPGTDLDMGP